MPEASQRVEVGIGPTGGESLVSRVGRIKTQPGAELNEQGVED
jgi:hypothetical protein